VQLALTRCSSGSNSASLSSGSEQVLRMAVILLRKASMPRVDGSGCEALHTCPLPERSPQMMSLLSVRSASRVELLYRPHFYEKMERENRAKLTC
jgi:hypothetical protein